MKNKIRKIEEGDSYVLEKTITEDMVNSFAKLSGDYNPVHMDEKYCRGHGINGRIVHGMLLLSFLSTFLGMHFPGEGTLWLSNHIDFISPAKIGDSIRIKGTVTDRNTSNVLGLDILEIKISISNQLNKVLARGKVKVCIK